MNILKSLILFVTLFNLAFSQSYLPSIQTSQLTDEPAFAYYAYASQIGVFPLSSGCNKYYQIFGGVYYPIVVLNETSFLAYQNTLDGQLSIAVVSQSGFNQLPVPSQLQQLAINKNIKSSISYDDKNKAYIFIDSLGHTVNFNILTNSWMSTGIENFAPLPNPYYDLTSHTLYSVGVYTINSTTTVTGILSVTSNSGIFYHAEDFHLQVGIEVSQITGYQNNIILFGRNSTTQKSYLYLLDTYSQAADLIATSDYGASIIPSVNPRYVTLVNGQKSAMSLVDLETYKFVSNFSNNCVPISTVSFLTSIAIKDIFVN